MASREPSPTETYTRIRLGDIGYIDKGQFHLLFSAGLPLGARRRGIDVPHAFEELPVESNKTRQPLPPGCTRTDTVQAIQARAGVFLSAVLYVQFFESSSHP